MDKIQEFVAGVKFLAPGIVVASIFYMYADVKFEQFGYLLFCAVAIILISVLTDALLAAATVLVCATKWAIEWWGAEAKEKKARSAAQWRRKLYSKTVRTNLNSASLVVQFLLAIALGVAVTSAHEDDRHFRWLGRLVPSAKINQRDTLDHVLKKIASSGWDWIDERPPTDRPCTQAKPGCERGVYLRIKTRQGDVYEGGLRFVPTRLEAQGFYLSPSCVTRIQDKLIYAPIEKIVGPGVYIAIGDAAAVDFLDHDKSACYKLFYPAPPAKAGQA